MANRYFTEKKVGGSIAVFLGFLSLYEASKLFSYSKQLLTGDHAFPGVIGLLFVLFGASLFFERGPQEERVLFPKGKTLRTLLLTIFFLFLYCYLIPIAGYTISTLAASICLIRMIGQYKWLFSAILGAILTTVLYSIFILLLKTPVPSGIFPI